MRGLCVSQLFIEFFAGNGEPQDDKDSARQIEQRRAMSLLLCRLVEDNASKAAANGVPSAGVKVIFGKSRVMLPQRTVANEANEAEGKHHRQNHAKQFALVAKPFCEKPLRAHCDSWT